MPARAPHAPRDYTGKKKQQLAEEKQEEQLQRAEELALITAEKTASLEEVNEEFIDALPSNITQSDSVEVAEEHVIVRTNCDLDNVTIGYGNTFNFKMGQRYKVPRWIADYLKHRDFLWM